MPSFRLYYLGSLFYSTGTHRFFLSQKANEIETFQRFEIDSTFASLLAIYLNLFLSPRVCDNFRKWILQFGRMFDFNVDVFFIYLF